MSKPHDRSAEPELETAIEVIRQLPARFADDIYIEALVRRHRASWAAPGDLKLARAQHLGCLLRQYAAWFVETGGKPAGPLHLAKAADEMLDWSRPAGPHPAPMSPWVTAADFPALRVLIKEGGQSAKDRGSMLSADEEDVTSVTEGRRMRIGPMHQLFLCNRDDRPWEAASRAEVIAIVGEVFSSFTVQEASGVFCSAQAETLIISLGSADTPEVCALGHLLRNIFAQEGVGLVCGGVYERLIA